MADLRLAETQVYGCYEWIPEIGDEVYECPDCGPYWRCEAVEVDGQVGLREWHVHWCPVWGA